MEGAELQEIQYQHQRRRRVQVGKHRVACSSKLTVIAIGMLGYIPNRNATAFLELGILMADHKQVNRDLRDLAVKHMHIMGNIQRNSNGVDARRDGGSKTWWRPL